MMKKYKLRKDFTDAQKIKKFDEILKYATRQVKIVVNDNYGYDDLDETISETVLEALFGMKIWNILDEDKRGTIEVE